MSVKYMRKIIYKYLIQSIFNSDWIKISENYISYKIFLYFSSRIKNFLTPSIGGKLILISKFKDSWKIMRWKVASSSHNIYVSMSSEVLKIINKRPSKLKLLWEQLKVEYDWRMKGRSLVWCVKELYVSVRMYV